MDAFVIDVNIEEVYSRHIFSRFDQKLIEFIINEANSDFAPKTAFA